MTSVGAQRLETVAPPFKWGANDLLEIGSLKASESGMGRVANDTYLAFMGNATTEGERDNLLLAAKKIRKMFQHCDACSLDTSFSEADT
ncbi:hypothetical protein M8C21_026966 [Ambrosia artemisiifolia]|uniref:Uncharacterized protein n=1 Tax=Ambrosia artemisiifolia TaxID=4212 RepID=A0AAD5GIC7_AMBAR|nr:hypothetical protein M8C21_026966 [Ambrosia artemisiifolia]